MYIPARNASRLVDARAFAERAILRDLTYLLPLILSITCSRWVGLQQGYILYTYTYIYICIRGIIPPDMDAICDSFRFDCNIEVISLVLLTNETWNRAHLLFYYKSIFTVISFRLDANASFQAGASSLAISDFRNNENNFLLILDN